MSTATNHEEHVIMHRKFLEWCMSELISHIDKYTFAKFSFIRTGELLRKRIPYLIKFLPTCQHFAFSCRKGESPEDFLEHWHRIEQLNEHGILHQCSRTQDEMLEILDVVEKLTGVEMRDYEHAAYRSSSAENEKFENAMNRLGYQDH